MAIITEKSVVAASIDNLWEYVLDPAHFIDSFSEAFGFYYESLPIKFTEIDELKFEMHRWYVAQEWIIEVDVRDSTKEIILTQTHGPFRRWRYLLKLEDHGEGQCLLIESIDYKMKFSILGGLVDDLFLKSDLKNQLKKRHEYIKRNPLA